ncbi:MAG: CopG family transcriptional regulator [Gammaproteobacteria bacterium]
MGQVTVYFEDDIEKRLKSAAKAAGIPVSRWVAALVEEKTRTTWPESVFKLAGAWPDFPEPEELRRAQGEDHTREPL